MLTGKSTLNHRLAKAVGAQGFSQAVQIGIRLAEVPLLLGFWGVQLYGEWLLVSAIPVYLAIADGGFTGAASRDMSIRSGAGDKAGVVAVFQSTSFLLILVSMFVMLLLWLLSSTLPLAKWLGIVSIPPGDFNTILMLLVFHVLVSFHGWLLSGGFWCSGRYPLGTSLAAVTQLIEFMSFSGVVACGGGPVAAAWGYLAGRLFGTVLTWGLLRFVSPWLRYGLRHVSSVELRKLIAPAFATLAFPLGNALNIQGMRLIIGVVLGPPALAIFTSIRTLSRFVMQPRVVVFSLLQPELALTFGEGDEKSFSQLFLRGCQTVFWICLVVCVVMIAVGYWLFPVWTNDKIIMDWPLYALLLSAAWINSIWYSAMMVPYATNRHGRVAIVYMFVFGGAAFILGYFGAMLDGLFGVGIALFLVEIVMLTAVLPSALCLSGHSWSVWLRNVCTPPLFLLWEGLAVVGLNKHKSGT